MPGNPGRTVYVGNLDERVNDKVLYEILIQAGRVIDLYIPRDKETNRPRGYAFAEYENEESAGYAVRLFSGLVSLYNRTLKFAISGQDKPPQNSASPMVLASNTPPKPRQQSVQLNNNSVTQQPTQLLTPCRFSAYSESISPRFSAHPQSVSPNYPQAPPPGLVGNRLDYSGNNYDYDRRVFGAALDSIGYFDAHSSRAMYESRGPIPHSLDSNHPYEGYSSRHMYDSRYPIPYTSY